MVTKEETIMTEPRNEYRIKGRIVTERPGPTPDTTIVTIIIKNEYRDIFPEVRCKKDMLPAHKEHSVLEIEGYIANDPKKQDISKCIPRLYASHIRLASPILEKEFGVKGRFWEPCSSMFYVTGTIAKINEDTRSGSTYLRYLISTIIPGTDEKTLLRIDWKKIDRHPVFEIGDEICAVCKINTPQKKIGTEKRHFLNLDVFDMNKLVIE